MDDSPSNDNSSVSEENVVVKRRPRKPIDRFDGIPEEEVMKKILPDYLKEDLDIIVVGVNPGLISVHLGHHYAGPGNHFWICSTEAGLIDKSLTFYDDYRLTDYGIGFTNLCARPTKCAADLTRSELKEGLEILKQKLYKYRPKIVVFNGKGIYEIFNGNKNFSMGRQPELLKGTESTVFVMPSSSARCAQLPRAEDKLPFFVALKKVRDHLTGLRSELGDDEVVFPDYTEMRITKPDPKGVVKSERKRQAHTDKPGKDKKTNSFKNAVKSRREFSKSITNKYQPSCPVDPSNLTQNNALKSSSVLICSNNAPMYAQPLMTNCHNQGIISHPINGSTNAGLIVSNTPYFTDQLNPTFTTVYMSSNNSQLLSGSTSSCDEMSTCSPPVVEQQHFSVAPSIPAEFMQASMPGAELIYQTASEMYSPYFNNPGNHERVCAENGLIYTSL